MMKEKILKAGLKAWKADPCSVTASNIARMIGVTHATILYHFPEGVKDAVAKYAVEKWDVAIIAQLIVTKHRATKELTPEQKMEILKAI